MRDGGNWAEIDGHWQSGEGFLFVVWEKKRSKVYMIVVPGPLTYSMYYTYTPTPIPQQNFVCPINTAL